MTAGHSKECKRGMRKKVFVFIDDTSGQFVEMPEHKMWEEHKPPCIYLESPFQGPETRLCDHQPWPALLGSCGCSRSVTRSHGGEFIHFLIPLGCRRQRGN